MNTDKAIQLVQRLKTLINSNNVYYQQPESYKMNYPCIRLTRSSPSTDSADNKRYRQMRGYDLVVIDPRPDNPWIDLLQDEFMYIQHMRHYTADNLNHDYFRLYF